MENNREDSKQEELQKLEKSSIFQNYSTKITELFKSKTQILKEDIQEVRKKASEVFINLSEVIRTNAKIKLFFMSNKNSYTNYLFSYFGYRYETNLENAKFYHFISQAWILNVFDDIKNESSKKEYPEILKDILEKQVEDTSIIQSLELITGTLFISDPAIKVPEIRHTNIFLSNLKEIINERKKQRISPDLTKNQFDSKIIDMLSRAVNLTLNDVNQINDKKSLLLYETFNELSSKSEDLSLVNYINTAIKKLESSQEKRANDETFRNSCETYYNFAQTTLTELIYEFKF